MSEQDRAVQQALRQAMDKLDMYKDVMTDMAYKEMCGALRQAWDKTGLPAALPSEEQLPEEQLRVRLNAPGHGRLDLGKLPRYEDSTRFFTLRGDDRRLPATAHGVSETWVMLEEPANYAFMLQNSVCELVKQNLRSRRRCHFDSDAMRFKRRYRRKASGLHFRNGSVCLQLTGLSLSEDAHNLSLQVLDEKNMLFYVKGFGTYCMVLSLLPSPALVMLHGLEDEMMVSDPASMHFQMAMVAWQSEYWTGPVNREP